MKDSKENFNAGITFDLSPRKLIFQNALTIGFTKSNDSPYGSFSDYTQLNPYWKPYDDNGKSSNCSIMTPTIGRIESFTQKSSI